MSTKPMEMRQELTKLRSAVATAHNLIHQGDVEAAHRALHCGEDETEPQIPDAERMYRFSVGFNQLATSLGLPVAWVYLRPDPSPTHPKRARVVTGGHVETCKAIGENMGGVFA